MNRDDVKLSLCRKLGEFAGDGLRKVPCDGLGHDVAGDGLGHVDNGFSQVDGLGEVDGLREVADDWLGEDNAGFHVGLGHVDGDGLGFPGEGLDYDSHVAGNRLADVAGDELVEGLGQVGHVARDWVSWLAADGLGHVAGLTCVADDGCVAGEGCVGGNGCIAGDGFNDIGHRLANFAGNGLACVAGDGLAADGQGHVAGNRLANFAGNALA